jgi:hypothetical protein
MADSVRYLWLSEQKIWEHGVKFKGNYAESFAENAIIQAQGANVLCAKLEQKKGWGQSMNFKKDVS